MLENPRLSTIKLKNISKQEVSYLPSHFGLEGIITFKKKKKFVLISDWTLIRMKMKVIAIL